MKGDPLNLSVEGPVFSDPDSRLDWTFDQPESKRGKKVRLAEIGHGQVPFIGAVGAAGAVSFARITQRATLSFAQLRRISLGPEHDPEADASVRALLVSLGLHAHQLAFGRGFSLRSGADLRPTEVTATWLGTTEDRTLELGDVTTTAELLAGAYEYAKSRGVALDGWGGEEVVLTPRKNLRDAINKTWPGFED